MNKKELEIAIRNASTRAQIETVLAIVIEKLQDKKTGKAYKEELKKHEECLMEKLDNLEAGEAGEAKEAKEAGEAGENTPLFTIGEIVTIVEYKSKDVNYPPCRFEVAVITPIAVALIDLDLLVDSILVVKPELEKGYIVGFENSFRGKIVE